MLTIRIGVACVLTALALACGGGDDGATEEVEETASPTQQPTEAQTQTPEPTATVEPTPSAPSPQAPPVDQATYGDGRLSFELAPGGSYDLKTNELEASHTALPCADLLFVFGWQVSNPYPADGYNVLWRVTQEERHVDLDPAEPDGQGAAAGCGQLEAINQGDSPMTVAVHYVIASAH